MNRTWFGIDGSLEPIDFSGETYFRFPMELAERVIEAYSSPGDWIFDPFCGFGTTLVAAERMGRRAVGMEKEPERARFVESRTAPPNRVIVGNILTADLAQLPPFELVLTSPPYTSLRDWDQAGFDTFQDDLALAFRRIATALAPGARVVVEMSNVRSEDGLRLVAWDAVRILSRVFRFEGEIVRVNTGPEPAGPGYDHSYLLLFRHTG